MLGGNMKHHNTGRRNAAKDDKPLTHLSMRCKQSDKALIVRNLKRGETLTDFIIGLAVDEAALRQAEKSAS